MRDKYFQECHQTEENCIYTAEAHHIIALRQRTLATRVQLVPAVVAALSSLLVTGAVIPIWWGWLAVVSAVVTAVGSVLDPLKGYYDHLAAAKCLTALKHDARSLRETFSAEMDDKTLAAATKMLHDRYNDMIRFIPPTDERSFEEARKRVKQGIHYPD